MFEPVCLASGRWSQPLAAVFFADGQSAAARRFTVVGPHRLFYLPPISFFVLALMP
jgi:hypothetical protein